MTWAYMFFNLAILLPCLALSHLKKIGPLQRRTQLGWAYATVSMAFIVWDIIAARAGHWGFSTEFTLPFRQLGLPLEEVAFFFTIPFGCMLVWDALEGLQGTVSQMMVRVMTSVIGLASFLIVFMHLDRGYTRVAGFVALLVLIILITQRALVQSRRFWHFQAITLGLFVVCNLVLTGLPIITYGAGQIIGWRFVTIPLEDFFFNFALLNSFLLVYELSSKWLHRSAAK